MCQALCICFSVACGLGFDYLACGNRLESEKLIPTSQSQENRRTLAGWSSPRGTVASSLYIGYEKKKKTQKKPERNASS